MDLEDAFSSHVRSLASIAALVEDRVFPDVAEENSKYPYVTFQEIGGQPVHHLNGVANISDTHIQLDVWATTSKSRRQVAKALRMALDKYRGPMGSLNCLLITLENRAATFEEPDEDGEDAAEKGTYRMRMEFRVQYTEETPTHF